MFRALLLAASADRCIYLNARSLETKKLMFVRMLDRIPLGYDLTRILSATEPEIVLLDLQDRDSALECAHIIRQRSPQISIIGFDPRPGHSDCDVPLTVIVPFQAELHTLLQAIDDAVHLTRPAVHSNLLAFLPAKAGSGSSTIALNTAVALAALKKRVLLLEADLRSGVLSVMLNHQAPHSMQEVLGASEDLDGLRLRNYVTRAHGVDWLLSNRSPMRVPLAWDDYYRLLEESQSRYDFVLADLPELINPATCEIVRKARLVFNVCTPELLSLRLAEQRCKDLALWGVSAERVALLLNRWLSTGINREDVEDHLGRPVYHVFANDYRSVQKALLAGSPLAAHTSLSRQFSRFGAKLAGSEIPGSNSLPVKLKGLFRALRAG